MKRLFVHEKIYDAVRAELITMAKEVKIGDPFDPDVTMGPVQNKAQYERLQCVPVPNLCPGDNAKLTPVAGAFSPIVKSTGTRSRTRVRHDQRVRRATSSLLLSSTTLPTSAASCVMNVSGLAFRVS